MDTCSCSLDGFSTVHLISRPNRSDMAFLLLKGAKGMPSMPSMPSMGSSSGDDPTASPTRNPWVMITQWILKIIESIPERLKGAIVGAKEVVLACVILGVCVGLAIFAYILVFIIRPRFFTISHTADFDNYITAASKELASTIVRLSNAVRSGTLDKISFVDADFAACPANDGYDEDTPSRDALPSLVEALKKDLTFVAPRASLASDVSLYFRFHRSLSTMKDPRKPNMLARMDMKSEASFLSEETGEVDPDKITTFHEQVFHPMAALRNHVVKASCLFHAACGANHSPAISRAILDVHMLRLYLDIYHDQTTLSFETRKSGPGRLPIAVMTLYWWPEVEPTFTKTIPHLWIDAPKEFVDGLMSYDRGWDYVGEVIIQLPCHMSHMKKTEREVKCGGMDKIREGFGMGSFFSGVGELFGSLIPLVTTLADLVLDIARDPFGSLLAILMLILGLIIGLVLYLVYALLTITQVYWIPGVIYAWYVSFAYAWFMTVWEVIFTIALAIPYAILTLIDLVTGGLIMHLLRCESLPSEWMTQPFTAFGNVRKRLGGMCAAPCGRGGGNFVPALAGAACYCMPADLPPFCPQQQLFRALKAMPLGDPYVFDGFTANAGFRTMSLEAQQHVMAKAYRRKAAFLGRCYSASAPYSFVTRHLCSDLDALLPEDTDPGDRANLDSLCRQVNCHFGPQEGASLDPDDLSRAPEAVMLGQMPKFPMCSTPPLTGSGGSGSPEREASRLAYIALLFALATCVILALLYALLG